MQTVNLVVVDFVGRESSRFIGDLNEYYAELPKKAGRKHSRKAQLISLLEHWETFTKIEVDDSLHLAVFLAPLLPEDHAEKREQVWEVLTEGALGYFFVVANDKRTWDECANVIQQFHSFVPVPSAVVVYDHPLKDVDAPQLRTALGVQPDTPVFAHRSVLRLMLDEILKGLLARIVEDDR